MHSARTAKLSSAATKWALVKRWNLTPKQSVRFSGKTEVSDVNADGDTVVAKIINDVIELNKIRLDLDGMKPVGLRLEDKATRLLVNDDSGRIVVVDVATGESLLKFQL